MSSAASDSSASYVKEVDYPASFALNQAPVHLNYVAALNGVMGPRLDQGFRYCELGCGAGKTVNVLAAAYGEGEFLGIDFNPTHVEGAEVQAKTADLGNAAFLAADISKLDFDGLPDFDFIAMHGLYAWVPEAVREAILRFVAAKLRPGGLVYVSYNTLPGWSALAHIRTFFLDREAQLEGSPTEKAKRILDELDRLREEGAPFFAANPVAASVLAQVRQQDLRYVVHEFFAPSWQPMAFSEVNRDMEAAGLAFVGDAQVVHNFIEHAVPEAFVGLVSGMAERRAQEAAKDFINNRFFRADVYVRPDPGANRRPAEALLGDTLFGMEKTPRELSDTVDLGYAKAKLVGPCIDSLKNLLTTEVLSLAEVLAHPTLENCPRKELVEAVKLLSTERQISPFAARARQPSGPPPARVRCGSALNRALLAEAVDSIVVLASPVAGTGVGIAALEACLLQGLQSDDPVTTALTETRRRSLHLTHAGERLVDEAAQRAALEGLLPHFIAGKLPKFAALGVVEAW